MEATGGLEVDISFTLQSQGLDVAVITPPAGPRLCPFNGLSGED